MAAGNKTLEDLLRPISESLGRTQVPSHIDAPKVESVPQRLTDGLSQAQLVDMFVEEAEKVRVSVHRCTRASLGEALVAAIGSQGEGDVVIAQDERFSQDVPAQLVAAPGAGAVRVWDAQEGVASVDAAVHARYGIAYAQAGIAETATVVQPSSTQCGRSVTLTPLVHIAVVDASSIVATMQDFMASCDEAALPSQLCFISGPSATADIELVRVEGVHGPMYVHYVIVE